MQRRWLNQNLNNKKVATGQWEGNVLGSYSSKCRVPKAGGDRQADRGRYVSVKTGTRGPVRSELNKGGQKDS